MSIVTEADIDNGFYGKWSEDKDGNQIFVPYGKAVYVDEVFESLETGNVELELSFDFANRQKTIVRKREDVFDANSYAMLTQQGVDVTKLHYNLFIDTIRLQEQEIMDANGVTKTYSKAGWLTVPIDDASGNITDTLCFRTFKLLGQRAFKTKYLGVWDYSHSGDYNDYLRMIREEIIGHSAMEYVFLMAAAAPIVGLIADDVHIENPIVHIVGKSGTGKTTAAMLAASVCGNPNKGITKANDGTPVKPILGTWGATENATISQCDGNRGAVVVFNELGKFCGNDMSRIVYNLSEGDDKDRMNKNLELRKKTGYRTTFISNGEVSLLERCKSKLEGLSIRVLEISQPLTVDAPHSDRILTVVKESYGFITPKTVKYILDNGGKQFVVDLFDRYKEELIPRFPESPLRERFVSKFGATVFVTAEIVSQATGLKFDTDGVLSFLINCYSETENKRTISNDSYGALIEACRVNSNNFIIKKKGEMFANSPNGKIYGRITYPGTRCDDGRILKEVYEIRKSFVEETLKANGYDNLNSCCKAWKEMGVLDYERGRNTRSRKLVLSGSAEDVYVLNVYSQEKVIKSCVDELLAPDDDEEEEVAVCAETKKEAV